MTLGNREKIAVLAGGGIESSVLLANYADEYTVYPIFIKSGFHYEPYDLNALNQYIAAINRPSIQSVVIIDTHLESIYPNFWGYTDRDLPMSHDPEAAIIISGRNLFLLTMVAMWCATHQCEKIAIGTESNCGVKFYDNEEDFFIKCEKVLSHGVNQPIQIIRPFFQKLKVDIIKSNADLPLYLTRSCVTATQQNHCGICIKCARRKGSFQHAGVLDLTKYESL